MMNQNTDHHNKTHYTYTFQCLNETNYWEDWEESFKHSLWHLLRHVSFQLGTWCWLTQTVRAQASAHASRSDTPQTVTQVSGIGSFEKEPTFFNILFEVHTLSQTKISSELLSLPLALFNLCSSAFLFLTLNACPATTTGIAAPTNDHQISPISPILHNFSRSFF